MANDTALPDLTCACATLRRASRTITQRYDHALRPLGLRITQFTLLKALQDSGPVPQGRLGEWLSLDATTMSRTSRVLEREGWIEILPAEDRRERRLAVTAAGRKLLKKALPPWEKAQALLRKELGERTWKAVFEMGRGVAAAAGE